MRRLEDLKNGTLSFKWKDRSALEVATLEVMG